MLSVADLWRFPDSAAVTSFGWSGVRGVTVTRGSLSVLHIGDEVFLQKPFSLDIHGLTSVALGEQGAMQAALVPSLPFPDISRTV